MRAGGVLAFLLLTSCGAPPSVQPAIAPYVQEFRQLLMDRGRPSDFSVSVHFGLLERPANGLCQNGAVTIDPQAWIKQSDDEHRGLIYHELGHCVLGRAHNAGTQEFEITAGPAKGTRMVLAASIMNPNANAAAEYFSWGLLEQYENELFNGN